MSDVAPPDLPALLDSVVMLSSGASVCAGAVISPDGLVATAYHCVATGLPPRVEWRDGRRSRGTIVAWDPSRDLALVRADGGVGVGAPIVVRAEDPSVGETVWSLGHPYASASAGKLDGLLAWSVSKGIVGGVGDWLIQTDAPLNPGNSGGPLVDAQGRLVGIVSRKLDGEDLAFAARGEDVAAMAADPRPGPPLGGTWGAGGGVWLDTGATGLEGTLFLTVRERVVGRVWAGAGLDGGGGRSAATLEVRQRIGTGPLSTTIDVGGGVQYVDSGVAGVLTGRAAAAGVGFAVRYAPASDAWSFGVDLEWPGVVGVW